jgi:hypothetical protein
LIIYKLLSAKTLFTVIVQKTILIDCSETRKDKLAWLRQSDTFRNNKCSSILVVVITSIEKKMPYLLLPGNFYFAYRILSEKARKMPETLLLAPF